MLRGNQHGGRKYDDLQNWLDMMSYENLLFKAKIAIHFSMSPLLKQECENMNMIEDTNNSISAEVLTSISVWWVIEKSLK